MGNTYGLLGTGLRPSTLLEQEWIVCPASHEYLGTVRVTNQDTAAITYRLAHTPASGAASGEEWNIYDTTLEAGEVDDITMEMGPGATLRVMVSKLNVVSFNFSGMDRDNT